MNKQIKQRQQKITYDNDMLHWDLKAFQIQSMYTGILVKQSILHVHNSTVPMKWHKKVTVMTENCITLILGEFQ